MNERCGQFAEALISGYLDGVICASERRRVRVHLRRCAGCCRLLRDLRKLRAALLTTRYVHVPDPVPVSSLEAGYALPGKEYLLPSLVGGDRTLGPRGSCA